MRHKLNLNGPSSVFLRLIGLFGIAVPLALYLAHLLLLRLRLNWPRLLWLARASLAGGLAVLVVFVVLIVIEGFQDRRMDRLYRAQRKRKVAIGNGLYECQYCGNRQVRAEDARCGVCGKELA